MTTPPSNWWSRAKLSVEDIPESGALSSDSFLYSSSTTVEDAEGGVALFETPTVVRDEVSDLIQEISTATKERRFAGLLVKVERLLEYFPHDKDMKQLAGRLDQLEKERDDLFGIALAQFNKFEFENTIQTLDQIHPSFQDDAITSLRQRAEMRSNELRAVCESDAVLRGGR